MRKANIVWLILAVLCGALLFRTSQRVTDGRAQLTALEDKIAQERESIRVLAAEWSYLNQPERLERLSRQHLRLAPAKGTQIVSSATFIERANPKPPPEVAPETLAEALPVPQKNNTKEEEKVEKTKKQSPVVKLLKPRDVSPLTTVSLPRATKSARQPLAKTTRKEKTSSPTVSSSRDFKDVMKSLGVD